MMQQWLMMKMWKIQVWVVDDKDADDVAVVDEDYVDCEDTDYVNNALCGYGE